MVSGRAVDDALARARRWPLLRVGLHLVLVDGPPVSPPDAIPDLVDRNGLLRADLAMMGLDIFLRPGVRRQLAAEIDAQFAAFQATGLLLDHVNAHHHFHLHPTVVGQIFDVGRRYGMRAMRVPFEPMHILKRIEPSGHYRRDWLVRPWIRSLQSRTRRHGVSASDQVFGLAWSGAMTEQRLAGLLRNLPDGVTEIYVHPAIADDFASAARAYRYVDELAALTSPGVNELARAIGVRTGGFMDFCAR
jgi:chitin disaccharide deacetylase